MFLHSRPQHSLIDGVVDGVVVDSVVVGGVGDGCDAVVGNVVVVSVVYHSSVRTNTGNNNN